MNIPALTSARDMVFDRKSGALFVTDPFENRLLRIWPEKPEWDVRSWELKAGPHQMSLSGGLLAVNQLWGRQIALIPLKNGEPLLDKRKVISNDGPFWSLQLTKHKNQIWLAAGGIENHPLERTGGGFGYVDSFLFLYRIDEEPKKVAEFNLSEINLVTPKSLLFAGNSLWVSAYGSDQVARFAPFEEPMRLESQWSGLPGVSEMILLEEDRLAGVSPLLDRVFMLSAQNGVTTQPEPMKDTRSTLSRLGEMLTFTTLLTPENKTDGGFSRFTCEACHFEGGVDGRVHFTGRDDVHATPKTLRGLAGTPPLFSSGGDDTLSKMVEAEFGVANQGDADFVLETGKTTWLKHLGPLPERVTPMGQRIALLQFFVDFEHPPNPWLLKKGGLDEKALAGLDVFRDRCEDCHQAVTTTRGAISEPFTRWRGWLEDPNRDLIWASPFYFKTGVTPYFDPGGTQVPSLRRIQMRYPFLSDGSAQSLADVLKAFRYKPNQAWHRGGEKEGSALTEAEVEKLLALLRYF